MPKGITSLTGFVRKIEQIKAKRKGYLFFRGHGDKSFRITPSVYRSKNLTRNEGKLISHFQAELPELFAGTKYVIDKLVTAQHYGVPTRLLDFSLNPLVALYFACSGNAESDGRVISISLRTESVKFSESDTVSCLANSAFLSESEKADISAFINLRERIEEENLNSALNNLTDVNNNLPPSDEQFNEMGAVKKLVQFTRNEKPYFLNTVRPTSLVYPTPVLGSKGNARVVAQSGAFLIFGLERELDPNGIGFHTDFIDIRSESKKPILAALDSIGINSYSVFPDPEQIGLQIKRRYS